MGWAQWVFLLKIREKNFEGKILSSKEHTLKNIFIKEGFEIWNLDYFCSRAAEENLQMREKRLKSELQSRKLEKILFAIPRKSLKPENFFSVNSNNSCDLQGRFIYEICERNIALTFYFQLSWSFRDRFRSPFDSTMYFRIETHGLCEIDLFIILIPAFLINVIRAQVERSYIFHNYKTDMEEARFMFFQYLYKNRKIKK